MMLRGEQEKEEIVVWGLPMGQEGYGSTVECGGRIDDDFGAIAVI